jgi:hypothetical protein
MVASQQNGYLEFGTMGARFPVSRRSRSVVACRPSSQGPNDPRQPQASGSRPSALSGVASPVKAILTVVIADWPPGIEGVGAGMHLHRFGNEASGVDRY